MSYRSLRRQTLHYWARPQEKILREPLNSPAAWRGAQMRERDDWSTQLSTAEIAELHAAVRHAQAANVPLARMTAAQFPLPTLTHRIHEWRRQTRSGRGFQLIRGVPVRQWTPAQSEIFFWCFGLHFGVPGAQNARGDLLGHVRDERSNTDERFYRTNKELAVHTDTADVVGLLCLLPARSGGLSRIVSSVAVYNELLRRKPQLVDRLYAPLYFDTHGDGGVPAFAVPPCCYADGELRSFWQSDYTRSAPRHAHVPALSAQDHELLDAYDAIANSPEFYLDMDLQPGDVQLLNNHTQLHARTGFEDWPELERRRHLLRLWISLPQRRSWKLRLLTLRSGVSLLAAAARELLRERLGASHTV